MLAIIALIVTSTRRFRSHTKDATSVMELMYHDWLNGKVIEELKLPLLSASCTVSVVRDYREAKLGFLRLDENYNNLDISIHPKVEIVRYNESSAFVTLHKPYALRLEQADRTPTVSSQQPK